MAHIIIKKIPGTYDNYDAFDNVISYINKQSVHIGGYGFIPINATTAIEAFNKSNDSMDKIYPIDNKLWHIIFSFDNTFSYDLVNSLSQIFCKYLIQKSYYSFYGIHLPESKLKLREYHVHFCIPTFPCNIYYTWNPSFVLSLLENYAKRLESDYEDYQEQLKCAGVISSKSHLTIRREF